MEMKKISNQAYNQATERVKKINKLSTLYKEKKDPILDLYNKLDKLKNHIIMLDGHKQNIMIFALSARIISESNKILI